MAKSKRASTILQQCNLAPKTVSALSANAMRVPARRKRPLNLNFAIIAGFRGANSMGFAGEVRVDERSH
jgi:hypothetical protein